MEQTYINNYFFAWLMQLTSAYAQVELGSVSCPIGKVMTLPTLGVIGKLLFQ